MSSTKQVTQENNEISDLGAGPMLNAYPDSLGGTLGDLANLLEQPELTRVFDDLYILPSLFNTDLDRGFSVIDYGLNRLLANPEDLKRLRKLGIGLKLDFILNHSSVLSPQFQDVLKYGEKSKFRDFFIDWNKFWTGQGELTPDGYIQPNAELIRDMFFRKPGLPIISVRFPDGSEVFYWNTFYQEVCYDIPDIQTLMRGLNLQYGEAERLKVFLDAGLSAEKKPKVVDLGSFVDRRREIIDLLESRRTYLGQMDLNINSPLVWEFYDATLKQLGAYGAEIVRLDAFAYAPKKPGKRNFLNIPDTWELLKRVRGLADQYNLKLLPEIHSQYGEKIHEKISELGYLTYDFFLPGLIIDAFERQTSEVLVRWIHDIQSKGIRTVNMLGCHDGIPLLDLKGLLSDEQIQNLIKVVVGRGGYVKDLHGQKNVYYQVNATYYSALGEDDRKMLLARAIQIFMPGKPQIWYLDLFAGKNNYAAVEKAGSGGHKEINRTNLTWGDIREGLDKKIVQQQIDLIRFRAACGAFGFEANLEILASPSQVIKLRWKNNGCEAVLEADFAQLKFTIEAKDNSGNVWRL